MCENFCKGACDELLEMGESSRFMLFSIVSRLKRSQAAKSCSVV